MLLDPETPGRSFTVSSSSANSHFVFAISRRRSKQFSLGTKQRWPRGDRSPLHDRNGWPLACSASRPPPGSSHRTTASSDRRPSCARRTSLSWSTTPGSWSSPWVAIPDLGSHILALIRRRLPEDWTARYNTTPVLVETFVEIPRHTGAVYRASGWIRVGTTRGRERYDRYKKFDKPQKNIWLRPLRKDWKRTLVLTRHNDLTGAVCRRSCRWCTRISVPLPSVWCGSRNTSGVPEDAAG